MNLMEFNKEEQKKMNKNTVIIRIILSILLMFGIYKETGVWTTLAVFLLFLSVEGLSYIINPIDTK